MIDELLRNRRKAHHKQELAYNSALLHTHSNPHTNTHSSESYSSDAAPVTGGMLRPFSPTDNTTSVVCVPAVRRPSLAHTASYPVSKSPDFFGNCDELNSVHSNSPSPFQSLSLNATDAADTATTAAAQSEPDQLFLKVYEYFSRLPLCLRCR